MSALYGRVHLSLCGANLFFAQLGFAIYYSSYIDMRVGTANSLGLWIVPTLENSKFTVAQINRVELNFVSLYSVVSSRAIVQKDKSIFMCANQVTLSAETVRK